MSRASCGSGSRRPSTRPGSRRRPPRRRQRPRPRRRDGSTCDNELMTDATSFYDAVGGSDTFRRLVGRFYAGVAGDPVLRPLYPDEDWELAPERLRMFLEQYWGGPRTYSEQRGHPRLRQRHAPFVI